MIAPPFDIDVLALLNHPGYPALDAIMTALSNRLALLAIVVVVAVGKRERNAVYKAAAKR